MLTDKPLWWWGTHMNRHTNTDIVFRLASIAALLACLAPAIMKMKTWKAPSALVVK